MNRYKTDLLDLRCMDCMELLRDTPDKAYDLAIVDPPYGIGAGGEGFKNGSSKSEKLYFRRENWDLERPSKEYFDELRRVSKNQIIWGGNYFSDMLPAFRCFISWDKTIHGNSYADCELAWTSFDQVARYFRENIAQTNSEGRIHPTQKSIKLYSWLLHNYAKPGDKILDTHLGSCSIAIACHYAGYHLTGCELDEDYFKAGVERVKRETAQRDMFTEGLI
jgi:site-specific DNA-methyltransferase (adenine-specific)